MDYLVYSGYWADLCRQPTFPHCPFYVFFYLLRNNDATVDNHPYLVCSLSGPGYRRGCFIVGISGRDPLVNCGPPGSVQRWALPDRMCTDVPEVERWAWPSSLCVWATRGGCEPW